MILAETGVASRPRHVTCCQQAWIGGAGMPMSESDHGGASLRAAPLSSELSAHILEPCLPVLHHTTFIRTGKTGDCRFCLGWSSPPTADTNSWV